MKKQSYIKTICLLVAISNIAITLQFDISTKAFSQAVPLTEINTGNSILDKSVKEFYDCIEEEIDKSKGDPDQISYFEDEPTKHEVTTCYEDALANAPVKQKETVNNIEANQPEMVEKSSEKVTISSEEPPRTTKEFVSESSNPEASVGDDLGVSLVNVDIN